MDVRFGGIIAIERIQGNLKSLKEELAMAKRAKNHLKAQLEGKIRDNYRCQICGSTILAEGHHIIDHQYGGRGDKDNIVTLCNSCHKKVHSGKLDIYVF